MISLPPFIKEHKVKTGLLFLLLIDTISLPFINNSLPALALMVNLTLAALVIFFKKTRVISFFKEHKALSGLLMLVTLTALSIPFMRNASIEKEASSTGQEEISQVGEKESNRVVQMDARTSSKKNDDNSRIELVWAESNIDFFYGGIDVDNYILFKDGTVYKNCTTPLDNLQVNISKKQQPKQWTEWRKRRFSGYEILNRKKNTWEKLLNEKAVTSLEPIKARSGEKLNAKYTSAGGGNIGGSSSFKNSITFKPDGRFEMARFSMRNNDAFGGTGGGKYDAPLVSSANVSDKRGSSDTSSIMGKSVGGFSTDKRKDGSKNTGTYHLDDYTITLKHDNGFEHTELFFFMNPEKKSIMYKSDLFWIPK